MATVSESSELILVLECLSCSFNLATLTSQQLISCPAGHSQLCLNCITRWRRQCEHNYRAVTCPICRAEFEPDQLEKVPFDQFEPGDQDQPGDLDQPGDQVGTLGGVLVDASARARFTDAYTLLQNLSRRQDNLSWFQARSIYSLPFNFFDSTPLTQSIGRVYRVSSRRVNYQTQNSVVNIPRPITLSAEESTLRSMIRHPTDKVTETALVITAVGSETKQECLNCCLDLSTLTFQQLIECPAGHTALCHKCIVVWSRTCYEQERVLTCPLCRAEYDERQLNKNWDIVVPIRITPEQNYASLAIMARQRQISRQNEAERVVRLTTLTLTGSDFDSDDVASFRIDLVDNQPEDSISNLTISDTVGEYFNPPGRRHYGITANNYRGYQTSAESPRVGLTLPDVA